MKATKKNHVLLISASCMLVVAFVMATIAILNAKMSLAERFSAFTVEFVVLACVLAVFTLE